MGWNYGRKIIEALFAGRTKCAPVRAELESRREADRDRGDIRVFEAGLSAQQYGNHQQGARVVAEQVAAQLTNPIGQKKSPAIPPDYKALVYKKRVEF